jgi:hypothetical protein
MICFVHIEKAAGTTLHHILSQNYKSYMRLSPFYWPVVEKDVITAREIRWLMRFFPFTSGFGGHGVRSYLDYEKAARASFDYITVVREPIARFRSHFLHQRERMGIPWPLDTFIAEPRFHNIMTRKICGKDDVEAAKDMLRNYAFVGLIERFDESMVLLRQAISHGKPLNVHATPTNVAPKSRYNQWAEELEKRHDDMVRANALDIELYRFVVEELYPRQVEAFPGDLDAQVEKLREKNKTYTFPRLLYNAQRIYKGFGYSRVEKVLRGIYHKDEDKRPAPGQLP